MSSLISAASSSAIRMPTIFVPHGAGPCFAIAITGMASGVGSGPGDGPFDYVLGKPLDFDAFDAVLAQCAAALPPSAP